MTIARFIDPHGLTPGELAQLTAGWFSGQGYQVTVRNDQYGRTIVPAYKGGGWRTIFGFNLALTTIFTPQADGKLVVELGGETWDDKVVVGAIGFVLLPPLLFTAAIGAWQQAELDDKVWQLLGDYIYSRTGQSPNVTVAVPYNPYSAQAAPGAAPSGQYSGYYSTGYAPQGQEPSATLSQNTPNEWPAVGYNPNQKNSWFDPNNTQPVFSSGFTKMATWQQAIEDGIIVDEEIEAQSVLVAKLQEEVKAQLDDTQKAKVGEVLAAMERLEQLQQDMLKS